MEVDGDDEQDRRSKSPFLSPMDHDDDNGEHDRQLNSSSLGTMGREVNLGGHNKHAGQLKSPTLDTMGRNADIGVRDEEGGPFIIQHEH